MQHMKPTITKQNGKRKTGKGFSPNELKECGINKQQAKQIGLPIDVKRKSTHQENAQTIKTHLQQAKEQADAKAKTQKTDPTPKKKAKR